MRFRVAGCAEEAVVILTNYPEIDAVVYPSSYAGFCEVFCRGDQTREAIRRVFTGSKRAGRTAEGYCRLVLSIGVSAVMTVLAEHFSEVPLVEGEKLAWRKEGSRSYFKANARGRSLGIEQIIVEMSGRVVVQFAGRERSPVRIGFTNLAQASQWTIDLTVLLGLIPSYRSWTVREGGHPSFDFGSFRFFTEVIRLLADSRGQIIVCTTDGRLEHVFVCLEDLKDWAGDLQAFLAEIPELPA